MSALNEAVKFAFVSSVKLARLAAVASMSCVEACVLARRNAVFTLLCAVVMAWQIARRNLSVACRHLYLSL